MDAVQKPGEVYFCPRPFARYQRLGFPQYSRTTIPVVGRSALPTSILKLVYSRQHIEQVQQELPQPNMKISAFRVENFRNIRYASCDSPPDFLVICGGNGAGKSALLQALMTAKENVGGYGYFNADARAVSADADFASVSITLTFTPEEQASVKARIGIQCPPSQEFEVRLQKDGSGQVVKGGHPASTLLSYYSSTDANAPGYFDYIEAYRLMQKVQLSNWDSSSLSDERMKQTLVATSANKFQNTKAYLASLVMRDLQDLQKSQREGQPIFQDSLRPIKQFFDTFFAPMKFVDVRIDKSPFQFIITTPRGTIDIDDLSSGEKEIFSTFIRFHHLKPKNAVILFDEADAHLHPDIERRYLEVLREISTGNQVWLTTHSPEMMIAAGTESLFTVLKEPSGASPNQFQRVTSSEQLHSALSEVMGSRGLISFNQRVVFIEGEEASADREVYERLYPPSRHNTSFVPAGNSATVRMTAERVNTLLSVSTGFQQFYSIVDGDIERATRASARALGRLFQLPVYHVENFLLNPNLVLQQTREMLASKCPFQSAPDVENELQSLVLSSDHIKPYSRALLDARVAKMAKEAYDGVFQKTLAPPRQPIEFEEIEREALITMEAALKDGSWRSKCKGREVLKAYCAKHAFNYMHFRNGLIAKLAGPPTELQEIMGKILS